MEAGDIDEMLRRIETAIEVWDDIHDTYPMMICFFELMMKGHALPVKWQKSSTAKP